MCGRQSGDAAGSGSPDSVTHTTRTAWASPQKNCTPGAGSESPRLCFAQEGAN